MSCSILFQDLCIVTGPGPSLAETEEFKKAIVIKVEIDRVLCGAKLQTILAGKNLYLTSTRNSKANEKEKLQVLVAQSIEKHRTKLDIKHKVPLDMIITGAVLVSREGYRSSRGNGYNDLDIGLLTEVGSITPNTIIANMAHDSQVVENLQTNLFQKYDAPVDLIVTSIEVIRVARRPARSSGVFWELLFERRLKVQALKEFREKEAKVITLKEEDTDAEQFQQKNRNRRRLMPRRRIDGLRWPMSKGNNEQQGGGDGNDQSQKRNVSRRRAFNSRQRRQTKSDGDQSGVESKSQDRKSGNGGRRRQRFSERGPSKRNFSINSDIRVKDLKRELRNHQCNPLGITWKGHHGHCY